MRRALNAKRMSFNITTSSFQHPYMAFDQAHSSRIRIQRPGVEFLGDHAGKIRPKDHGQKVPLKETRPFVGLNGQQIDVCVEENRQGSYL